MRASTINIDEVKKQLAKSENVRSCAKRHNTIGDLSAMKVCYLLRHYPDLSVSEIANLVGLSVSAASRCLTKLKTADVVTASKQAQTVRFQLKTNAFTKHLATELGDNQ